MKQYKVYQLDMCDVPKLVGAFNADDERSYDYAKMLRNACYLTDEKDEIKEHMRYFILED